MIGVHPADAAREAAGFTGRFTAGLRYVESTHVPNPVLLSDPLAGVLAGDRGLELAKKELHQLVDAQGPGKHLRVPARSRLIDDMITQEISGLRLRKKEQEKQQKLRENGSTQGAFGRAGFGATSLSGSSGSEPGSRSRNESGSGASRSFESWDCDKGVVCQVVSLGAGMCTRPWRLTCLGGCRVFEVDLPHIAQAKVALLAEAGAQCTPSSDDTSTVGFSLGSCRQQQEEQQLEQHQHQHQHQQRDGGCNSPTSAATSSSSALAPTVAAGGLLNESHHSHGDEQQSFANNTVEQRLQPLEQQQHQQQHQQRHQQHVFPLQAASYACIGADLSTRTPTSLSTALTSHGFTTSIPTIWVLEALLYYMPLAAASELLSQLAALSAPGSRLIATCVDQELLEASLRGVPKDHVFADLWHFEAGALLYDTPAFRECWQVDWVGQPEQQEEEVAAAAAAGPAGVGGGGGAAGRATCLSDRPLPASTRRLAKERLGADTYVALYGGSELLFAAKLRQQYQS